MRHMLPEQHTQTLGQVQTRLEAAGIVRNAALSSDTVHVFMDDEKPISIICGKLDHPITGEALERVDMYIAQANTRRQAVQQNQS